MKHPSSGRLLLIWFFLSASAVFQPTLLPERGAESQPAPPPVADPLPELQLFIRQVSNGRSNEIAGLYLPGLAALSVRPQPSTESYFVADHPQAATLFSDSLRAGSIGLLAHSHLAGRFFLQLQVRQTVVLVYGDGETATYQVDRLERYQAEQPNDPYSTFISLGDGSRWTSQRLFTHVYASGPNLVLQTCLEQNGQSNWGRLFVIAVPAHDLLWKGSKEANRRIVASY